MARGSALHELLLSTEDLETFLQELAEAASAALPDVSAAVTLTRSGHPTTVASSDATASQLDEIQYGHAEGPCLTAMATGQTVHIEDTATEARFAEYVQHARELGLGSSLALPLDGGDRVVGALNLYSGRPHAFGETQRDDAAHFAADASRALQVGLRLIEHVERAAQLQSALTSRTVIDQAIGVIMGQSRCSSDEAFTMLRAVSQRRNVKLRTVAAEIVDALNATAPPEPGVRR